MTFCSVAKIFLSRSLFIIEIDNAACAFGGFSRSPMLIQGFFSCWRFSLLKTSQFFPGTSSLFVSTACARLRWSFLTQTWNHHFPKKPGPPGGGGGVFRDRRAPNTHPLPPRSSLTPRISDFILPQRKPRHFATRQRTLSLAQSYTWNIKILVWVESDS